jgi:hypothetical protein
LDEAEHRIRLTGEIPLDGNTSNFVYAQMPTCFVRAKDLSGEVRAIGGDGNTARRQVFAKERECTSFVAWLQGFSPKEHREMNLLQEQRDWQRERDREDREWRADQAGKADKEARSQRREDRLWRILELIVMGVLVTVANVWGMIYAARLQSASTPQQPPASTQQPASLPQGNP